MPDFLLEIGCEEIPARMIDGAREELQRRLADLLAREALAAKPTVEAFSTPRRLAVLARDVRAAQPDTEEDVQGPSVKVAFKDGQPTPAATKFAEKVGVELAQLQRITTPKGEYLAARVHRKGRAAADVLAEALPKEIAGLYWLKSMYWRVKNERFVRPVHWLVALLDASVVPVEVFGVRAGAETRGHRMSSNGAVKIASPAQYRPALAAAGVFFQDEREQRIRKALDAAVRTIPGARWREDKALLNTVVNLTEMPAVLLGGFDPQFLSLPDEVLVTVMRDHQKYFAVEDSSGKLLPHFLAVLNMEGDREGIIRHGHERVLRARFNDARFFWDTDQKIPLKQRVEKLKSVTFQKDLGSYYEKAERVAKLADVLAADLSNAGIKLNRDAVHEAAWLSKTDLTTELVKEFTELQGVVGGLYARAQGLGEPIALSIYDQYKPESMEDEVPLTIEGAVLSIADKADSIAGMFALGLIPSGSKDPFALRRQANGIVKTVADKKLAVSLLGLVLSAIAGYQGAAAEKNFAKDSEWWRDRERLTNFARASYHDGLKQAGVDSVMPTPLVLLWERLQFYLRDVRGFAYDVVNAVLAAGADDVVDVLARAEAVARVRPLEDFEHISIAFKRIKNILRQAREEKKAIGEKVEPAGLHEDAERALADAMSRTGPQVKELSQQRKYAEALSEIAAIRPVVDTFFDKVMVMVEDERVRANRLALLQALLDEFSTIADFSEIVTEKRAA
jgi:glycyl-tRNA synthetase beta chain